MRSGCAGEERRDPRPHDRPIQCQRATLASRAFARHDPGSLLGGVPARRSIVRRRTRTTETVVASARRLMYPISAIRPDAKYQTIVVSA